jgi:hypothetical protein
MASRNTTAGPPELVRDHLVRVLDHLIAEKDPRGRAFEGGQEFLSDLHGSIAVELINPDEGPVAIGIAHAGV